jgi:capsular polysaccharide transport system permease protein
MRLVAHATLIQSRVLGSIFIKEAGLRRGRSFAFGWLLAALEPLIIVTAASLMFSLLVRAPMYGDSLLLFIGTGVFPMYLVIYSSVRVREPAIGPNAHRFPIETSLDDLLIHAILHLITTVVVAVGFFFTLSRLGVRDAIPYAPMTAISAVLTLLVLGMGIGLVNTVIARFFPLWAMMWPAIIRGMVHLSGLYIVADYLRPDVRAWFDLNPLLNGVNWFRQAFYPHYPAVTSHPGRIMLLALASLTLGIALERTFRRGLLRGEYSV